jgi:glyoxylase-like metal-dependent hydrolase (beta-lactamase superfamily II)
MVLKVENKLFPSNTYLLANETNYCVIIDPGLSPELIGDEIEKNNLKPECIVCTHGHFDHIASVSYFKEKYNIPFYLHAADLKISKSANFYLKVAKINYTIKTTSPDFVLDGFENKINTAHFQFSVWHYPGHSDGSCIVSADNNLFTGDLFYKKGLGFNNFPGENRSVLKNSIRAIFDTFDNATTVYPGHGDFGKLAEMKQNQSLIAFLNQ